MSATKTKRSATRPARRARAPKGQPLRARAAEIERRLRAAYPEAHCELEFADPLQLLVSTILSAQCTDKRVNMVTPVLFERYADVAALAGAAPHELERIIRSTGFFRGKAKNILGAARRLLEHHAGRVPRSMDELTALPGVGRKTANVVLGNAFGVNEGVVVDTHVARLSKRLGLTKETDAVKIERSLLPLFPKESWTMLSHLLISHGRSVCGARKPQCGRCVLQDLCPSAAV